MAKKYYSMNEVPIGTKMKIKETGEEVFLVEIQNYWYLFFAVLIGGQIGNYLNLKVFPTRLLALVTACLVLFVAFRMGFKFF